MGLVNQYNVLQVISGMRRENNVNQPVVIIQFTMMENVFVFRDMNFKKPQEFVFQNVHMEKLEIGGDVFVQMEILV